MRFPTTLIVLVIAIVGLVGGWFLFVPTETQRYREVAAIRNQRSAIHLVERIVHAKGSIAWEELRLDNDNGRSSASYAVADRKNTIARFRAPIHGYDVTFAFDLLVRDGIWDLQTPRVFHGSTALIYTISIAQVAGARTGAHQFSFADPHWLATEAGRQYEIHLGKGQPVPNESDLLGLQSTSTADPRYQKIVDDFASFGPPGFRRTVAEARRKLLRS